METPSNRLTKKQLYDLFMLLLSVYVVVELALEIVSDWPEETIQVLDRIDLAICIVFLSDWFYFLYHAENKSKYVKSRFLDFVSSIPYAYMFRAFRVFRAVRILRTLRLLRGLKGMIPILRVLTNNKRRSALSTYVSCTLVIYLYCSLGLLNFEKGVNEKLNTFEDALWCSFTTLTTVGYGDIYPVTREGRMMAAILVITGMGLFSMITAEFAATFLRFLKEEEIQDNKPAKQ